ncbi:MAG: DMT family transporter [Bacteroidia bacterium]|nr:DMT family transporter [Bacteroidia bacterium]
MKLQLPQWSTHTRSWIMIVVLTLIWGSSFIMLKRVLEVFSPPQVFSGRMMTAAIVLLPFALREFRRIPAEKWPVLVMFSFLANLLTTLLYATAQTKIDSALNGMINTLTPLMTLVAGVVFYRQSVRMFQVLGLLLGVSGAVLLIIQASEGQINGINTFALIAVAATICNGFTVNIVKYNLAGLSVIQLSSLSFLIIFPIAFGYALYSGFFPRAFGSKEAWVATGFLLVLGAMANALGLILLSRLIQISTPVFATLTTYLIPIVALYWGYQDGEIITWKEIAAMGLILLSVYIVDRWGEEKESGE